MNRKNKWQKYIATGIGCLSLLGSLSCTPIPPFQFDFPTTAKIAGVVKDKDGKPVANAKVKVGEKETVTNSLYSTIL